MDDQDNDFQEESPGSIYSPKSEFKKASLAAEAVRVCIASRATEMKQGFWNNRIDKQGNGIRVWQEDQRKKFINSVIALQTLLSAECENDEDYAKAMKTIDNNIKECFDTYAYSMFEYNPSSSGWTKTDKKVMPQIEDELLVPAPNNPRTLINVKGGWDYKINAYYDDLVLLYDQIFKELNNVIYRLNDFAEKFTY